MNRVWVAPRAFRNNQHRRLPPHDKPLHAKRSPLSGAAHHPSQHHGPCEGVELSAWTTVT